MKHEIQNSNPINFKVDKPVSSVGERKFYKCSFKESSLKKGSSLLYTDLYYITKDYKEINNGAYLCINYDDDKKNILFFEYLRKPNEDLESIEYAILDFIKKMNYDINSFRKSDEGHKYYNSVL